MRKFTLIFLALLFLLPATSQARRRKHKSKWLKSPTYGLRYRIPKTLTPEVVGPVIDQRVAEFFVACEKWRSKKQCKRALKKTITIVDDYTFRCKESRTGLCAGRTGKGHETLIYYNKINTDNVANCPDLIKVRDRQAMTNLSYRHKKYWLNHQSSVFCGNSNDLLPALVHEMCHTFGRKVGHVAGKDTCEPVGKKKHKKKRIKKDTMNCSCRKS